MSLRTVAGMVVVHEVHAVAMWDMSEGGPAVVTDLDLVDAANAIGTADTATVASSPTTVAAHEPLIAAAALMADSGQSHLLVVDFGSRHPIGVLSTLDVIDVLAVGDNGVGAEGTERP